VFFTPLQLLLAGQRGQLGEARKKKKESTGGKDEQQAALTSRSKQHKKNQEKGRRKVFPGESRHR
jgi:hypothetical protein